MQDGAKIRTVDRFYHVQSVLTQLGTVSFIHSWKEKEGKLSFFVLYICHKEFILESKNNYQFFCIAVFPEMVIIPILCSIIIFPELHCGEKIGDFFRGNINGFGFLFIANYKRPASQSM